MLKAVQSVEKGSFVQYRPIPRICAIIPNQLWNEETWYPTNPSILIAKTISDTSKHHPPPNSSVVAHN